MRSRPQGISRLESGRQLPRNNSSRSDHRAANIVAQLSEPAHRQRGAGLACEMATFKRNAELNEKN
jgi:hypothetical protein